MAKAQKVVIKIGHTSILLPDDTGAANVLKTLSRGVVVWNFSSSVQLRKEDLEVGMTYLPASTKFTDEHDKPVVPDTPSKRATQLKPAPPLQLMGGSNRG